MHGVVQDACLMRVLPRAARFWRALSTATLRRSFFMEAHSGHSHFLSSGMLSTISCITNLALQRDRSKLCAYVFVCSFNCALETILHLNAHECYPQQRNQLLRECQVQTLQVVDQ